MNIRNILNPRKFFILLHRWASIVGGLLFIGWFVSGIVFTYWNMPGFGSEERLPLLAPMDLSTVRIEPMDAARALGVKPSRLRLSMYYDGRPVYKFQGSSIVYADTGEAVPGRDRNQALDFVRTTLEPAHGASVRYDRLMTDIDLWTTGSGGQLPLHKIAVGDTADTYYYISEKTGEPVMKTDRASRIGGFFGPVLHQWYFTPLRRDRDLWDKLVLWASLAGNLICLSGIVAGIWQFSIRRRYRYKGQPSISPYSNWMRWHHYAGLIFGLVTFTWIFSGGLAYSYGRGPSIDPTPEQRDVTTGGPINLEPVTLDSLRKALDAISPSFRPKEADVLQFRGRLYLTAADGPAERQLIGITERDPGYRPSDRLKVWLDRPDEGTFDRFDDSAMMDIAREAMPGIAITESEWINEYDSYYRTRTNAQPLPVLRVRYADPGHTWLYIDPHYGSIALSVQLHNRARRWLYNGLHKFDLPFIYDYRPLWDIAIIAMSIGGIVLSTTTLLPMFRRLRRHAVRGIRWGSRLAGNNQTPVPNERADEQV